MTHWLEEEPLQPPRRGARVARMFVLAVIALVLLPYAITLLYLVVNPVSTPMIWRWMTGERVTRIYLPLREMAPIMPLTVLIAEDARFCSHGGIDWEGLRTAIAESDDADDVRGASTITQQVAKNLFLWSGRSYLRKGLEFPLALWINLVLPKRRVLEIYLNIAEWGPDGEFGVEAGARRAFNVSARNVTAGQAALLAAMLPNPVDRDARRPGPGLRRLGGIYQGRAGGSPWIAACLGLGRAP